MGKIENIKRAKRLKEAKRKQKQDALIASGNGPAGKVLKKRIELAGGKLIPNLGKIKYFEILKSFVHPIVTNEDSIEIVKTKYTFGATAWNAAIMKEKSEAAYLLAKQDLGSLIPGVPEIELLFNELVKRKQIEFADYKNIIVDLDIKKIDEFDYDLTVATTALNDL